MARQIKHDINGPGPFLAKVPLMLIGLLSSQFIFWVIDVDFTPSGQLWILAPLFIGAIGSLLPITKPTLTSARWMLGWDVITMIVIGWMVAENYHYAPFLWALVLMIVIIWFSIPYMLFSMVTNLQFNLLGLGDSNGSNRSTWIPFIAIGVVVLSATSHIAIEQWQLLKVPIGVLLLLVLMFIDLKSIQNITPQGATLVLFEVMAYAFCIGFFLHWYMGTGCEGSYDFGCFIRNVRLFEHYYIYAGSIAALLYMRSAIDGILNSLPRDID